VVPSVGLQGYGSIGHGYIGTGLWVKWAGALDYGFKGMGPCK